MKQCLLFSFFIIHGLFQWLLFHHIVIFFIFILLFYYYLFNYIYYLLKFTLIFLIPYYISLYWLSRWMVNVVELTFFLISFFLWFTFFSFYKTILIEPTHTHSTKSNFDKTLLVQSHFIRCTLFCMRAQHHWSSTSPLSSLSSSLSLSTYFVNNSDNNKNYFMLG